MLWGNPHNMKKLDHPTLSFNVCCSAHHSRYVCVKLYVVSQNRNVLFSTWTSFVYFRQVTDAVNSENGQCHYCDGVHDNHLVYVVLISFLTSIGLVIDNRIYIYIYTYA